MEPISSPTPGVRLSPRTKVVLATVVILSIVAAFVSQRLLTTDIIGTSGSPIELSTDKLLYRTASGSTVPVTISVSGVTKEAPLVALKLTLDGLPSEISIDEQGITGSGSTVIRRAQVQRYGQRAIVLISDLEVTEEGPFVTLPLSVMGASDEQASSVVRIWSDPTPGSVLLSQVAVRQEERYLSYPLEDGPFFRLSSVETVGSSAPVPTDCPVVTSSGGTLIHQCPSPSAEPTGSGTVVSPSPSLSPSPVATVEASPSPSSTGSGTTPATGSGTTPATGSGTSPSPTGSGVVLSPSPSPSPSPTTAPIECSLPLRGDVNCDGRLTIADLVLVADFLAGRASLSQSQVNNANVAETAQGRVNLADVVAFAAYFSLQSPTL